MESREFTLWEHFDDDEEDDNKWLIRKKWGSKLEDDSSNFVGYLKYISFFFTFVVGLFFPILLGSNLNMVFPGKKAPYVSTFFFASDFCFFFFV